MTQTPNGVQRLYHLVQSVLWTRALEDKQPYFPPTYQQVLCTCLLKFGSVIDSRAAHLHVRCAERLAA